ncbi:MAG TPA: hypothetical protein DCL61_24095 [Cyanobacteria bacterium UBA12227]|nr:hypothetical protein [Cyanobacteria bacterium UBA12227]HAX88587.1 hypothetical protein [Cyanobacteria bacterium UBA11370]HBY76622.1 hypothetical protein [Cyanobacteria bacterium UBA11148]
MGFVQASARVRSGKFLTPSTDLLSKNLPHSQPQLQEFETDEVEIDEEEPFWRGVFVLPRSTKVLFSKEVEIKRNEVPTWKPCVVIDSYSLEDDKLLLGSSCELVFLWE